MASLCLDSHDRCEFDGIKRDGVFGQFRARAATKRRTVTHRPPGSAGFSPSRPRQREGWSGRSGTSSSRRNSAQVEKN